MVDPAHMYLSVFQNQFINYSSNRCLDKSGEILIDLERNFCNLEVNRLTVMALRVVPL